MVPWSRAHILHRNIQKPSDACMEWTGPKRPDGYGRLWFENKPWDAHRLAWHFAKGPIPEGMFVCHRCDNPGCYNPAHLFLGTAKDNTRDSLTKGRHGSLRQAGKKRGPYRSVAA